MPGPWISDAVVLNAIGRRLGKDPATLEAWATDLAATCNQDATADLTTIMLGQGYTVDQLDGWDYVATYVRRLAVWYAFNTPPLRTDGAEAPEKPLNPLPMLKAMGTITIGGVAVAPPTGGSVVGGISSGMQSGPNDAMFGDPSVAGTDPAYTPGTVPTSKSRGLDWFR